MKLNIMLSRRQLFLASLASLTGFVLAALLSLDGAFWAVSWLSFVFFLSALLDSKSAWAGSLKRLVGVLLFVLCTLLALRLAQRWRSELGLATLVVFLSAVLLAIDQSVAWIRATGRSSTPEAELLQIEERQDLKHSILQSCRTKEQPEVSV